MVMRCSKDYFLGTVKRVVDVRNACSCSTDQFHHSFLANSLYKGGSIVDSLGRNLC